MQKLLADDNMKKRWKQYDQLDADYEASGPRDFDEVIQNYEWMNEKYKTYPNEKNEFNRLKKEDEKFTIRETPVDKHLFDEDKKEKV